MPTVSRERSVILTFDDGPEPVDSLRSIVDTLDREQIRGCFFLLGQGVADHPEAAQLLAEHGHEPANHTWTHTKMPTMTESQMLDELRRTQEIIQQATGLRPTRFRPPHGAGWINEKCPEMIRAATQLGLEIVGWSLDTFDWKQPHAIHFDRVHERFDRFVAARTTRRLELLMHITDGTARDLPQLIDYLRSRDFTFTTYDG